MPKGKVSVLVQSQIVEEEIVSQNVIAEKPGPPERVVVLGGHYDSVPGTQSAHGNASGTAMLLAVAQEVAEQDFTFTLRFVAFGGRSWGHGEAATIWTLWAQRSVGEC